MKLEDFSIDLKTGSKTTITYESMEIEQWIALWCSIVGFEVSNLIYLLEKNGINPIRAENYNKSNNTFEIQTTNERVIVELKVNNNLSQMVICAGSFVIHYSFCTMHKDGKIYPVLNSFCKNTQRAINKLEYRGVCLGHNEYNLTINGNSILYIDIYLSEGVLSKIITSNIFLYNKAIEDYLLGLGAIPNVKKVYKEIKSLLNLPDNIFDSTSIKVEVSSGGQSATMTKSSAGGECLSIVRNGQVLTVEKGKTFRYQGKNSKITFDCRSNTTSIQLKTSNKLVALIMKLFFKIRVN